MKPNVRSSKKKPNPSRQTPEPTEQPAETGLPTSDHVPDSSKGSGPISLTPSAGPLPNTPDELLAVIQQPTSIIQALAAIKKLGDLYGRDIQEDMSVTDLHDFHPLISSVGIGNNSETIKSFAVYAVPLRRALARYFLASSPDVAMMIDLATLAYWKALMAERASVIYLTAALERPQMVDKVAPLERVKDLAVRQLTRLLEALRLATGRRATLDPETDAGKLLRFPGEMFHGRSRRAARG